MYIIIHVDKTYNGAAGRASTGMSNGRIVRAQTEVEYMYSASAVMLQCMTVHGLHAVCSVHCSLYCRYTACFGVCLQCALHRTAVALHFGLGVLTNRLTEATEYIITLL